MANFFGYKAVYADGHIEQEDGLLLWYLDGKPNVKNQRKLEKLKAMKADGIIVELRLYYES